MSDETVLVSVNLSIRTIVGCGQLLQRNGKQVEGVSIEQLVEGTITSMIPWFEKKGWIAPIDDPKMTFIAWFGAQVPEVAPTEPDLEIELVGKEVDGFKIGEDVEAAVQQKLREQAAVAANRSTEPKVVPDIERPGKINLLKVNRMDIAVLSTIAPKDVLIEKVTKGIGDAVFRAAVEIVYTSLAPELWGTPTAEQAIKDMMERHQGEA